MKVNKSSIRNASSVNSARMNKRGQEMTLGTIILIVLGIAVLVFLIYGFSSGWGNLWDRVTNLGGGDVNVDTIKTACALACQQNNEYGFCNQNRTVSIEDGYSVKATCNQLTGPMTFKKGDTPRDGVSIGVDACPTVSC